jgi:hypothetical protein
VLRTEQAATIDFTKTRARARAVATAINHRGTTHLTFARASQNVAAGAMLLDTLLAPYTDGVRKMYHQLKGFLNVAAE